MRINPEIIKHGECIWKKNWNDQMQLNHIVSLALIGILLFSFNILNLVVTILMISLLEIGTVMNLIVERIMKKEEEKDETKERKC